MARLWYSEVDWARPEATSAKSGLYGSASPTEPQDRRAWSDLGRKTLRLRYLLVAVGVLALASQGLAQSCATWNTRGFFGSATLARVIDCLNAGAEVDARDEYGHTPLHYAARSNDNSAVITALLDAGADATIRNGFGDTPWDLAQENEALRGTDAYRRLDPATVHHSDEDRFELFNYCEPMNLVVGSLSPDAAEIGLTGGSIQAAVESRLRSARLHDSESSVFTLYVRVTVVGRAFSSNLLFFKPVTDPWSDTTGLATTWETGSTGTHGGDADYILSGLSQQMDRFLLEFLRVNEEAC